jgi:heptosyltransferase-1
MHIAAALSKPGVAIFGPTDPARNGPYGGSLLVLRSAGAITTYKRTADNADMRSITPAAVAQSLASIGCPA